MLYYLTNTWCTLMSPLDLARHTSNRSQEITASVFRSPGMSQHSTSVRLQAQSTCARQKTSFKRTSTVSARASSHTPAPVVLTRREGALALAVSLLAAAPADAIGFKKELKKRKIPIEEYSQLANGLKYYDVEPGKGTEVAAGARVTAHFDCIYRGIDVVSTRSSRLLGGNRTVAEPFEFIAGEPVRAVSRRAAGDAAGGLFAGGSGPKPPPALSTAVIGMKVGGKRSVVVPPELGYGDQGEQEIGPGETFELKIEVLDVAIAL